MERSQKRKQIRVEGRKECSFSVFRVLHLHFRHDINTEVACTTSTSPSQSQVTYYSFCITASSTEPQKHGCIESLFLCHSVGLFFRDNLVTKVKQGPVKIWQLNEKYCCTSTQCGSKGRWLGYKTVLFPLPIISDATHYLLAYSWLPPS